MLGLGALQWLREIRMRGLDVSVFSAQDFFFFCWPAFVRRRGMARQSCCCG